VAPELADLNAFVAVARAGGFRDGARAHGGSASGLSEAVRRLEARLGVRLLNRTTRSVVPTEAGRRLLERLGPALNEVEAALDAVNDFRDRPAGTLRLNVPVSAAVLVLPDIVPSFLATYPEIRLEVVAEESFVDVIAAGCDAGIRYEERLEQDMIAVPIGPPIRLIAVATPSYFAEHAPPKKPQDLTSHCCINLRLSGGVYAWEFEKSGREVKVRVEGQVTVNGIDEMLAAAREGIGIGFVPEDQAAPYIKNGELKVVLDDWSQPFSGFHLYYASRKQMSPTFSLVVDALRYRPSVRR